MQMLNDQVVKWETGATHEFQASDSEKQAENLLLEAELLLRSLLSEDQQLMYQKAKGSLPLCNYTGCLDKKLKVHKCT